MSKSRDIADSAATINYIDGLTSDAQTQLNAKVENLTDLGVTATSTELNYVDGVTSAIQTQIDGKEPADATILKDADIGSTVLGYVAPSTSGNVLTSNGSAWTSAAPAGGGAWELLHTTTITSQASFITITSPFSSTYDNYAIHFDGLDSTNTSPVDFEFWLRKGGANQLSNYASTFFWSDSTSISNWTTSQGFIIGKMGNANWSGNYTSGFVVINSANTTASRSQLIQSQISHPAPSGVADRKFLLGNQGDSGAIDGFTLNIGSGDFQAGTIKVYGLKKS